MAILGIRTACVAGVGIVSLLVSRPLHAAPAPAPPSPTPESRAPHSEPLDVHFEPDEAGVSLLVANGSPSVGAYGGYGSWGYMYVVPTYSTACYQACLARFMPGTYDLGLEKGRHVAGATVTLSRPSILRAHYADRSALRTAGVILAIGGSIAGFTMMIASAHDHGFCDAAGYCYTQHTVDEPLFIGGIGVFVGSLVAGLLLGGQEDEAVFTIAPLTQSSIRPREGARLAAPEGVALTAAF